MFAIKDFCKKVTYATIFELIQMKSPFLVMFVIKVFHRKII
ncbi:unnamed protein product [Larinioides sclopetarius]|uniref:Uncharacterized protein n=2 Tax=Larinioides sclopetarius TaxID=280406 RepID=A0AAV2BTU7_9ARAC